MITLDKGMFNQTRMEKYFYTVHYNTDVWKNYIDYSVHSNGMFINNVHFDYLNGHINNNMKCLTGLVLSNKYKNDDEIISIMKLSTAYSTHEGDWGCPQNVTKNKLIEYIKGGRHPSPFSYCNLDVFMDNIIVLATDNKKHYGTNNKKYYIYYYNGLNSGFGLLKNTNAPFKEIKEDLFNSFSDFMEIPKRYLNLYKIYNNGWISDDI